MSDKEWAKLFELVGKVANMPGKTAKEKAAELKEKAEEHGALIDLGEFANYGADDE